MQYNRVVSSHGLQLLTNVTCFLFFFFSGVGELTFFFFIFIVVLGIHRGIYKGLTTNTLYLNSLLPSFYLILPRPIPRIVTTGFIFPYTSMCTQYLKHIYLPIPFSSHPPTSHWYQPFPTIQPVLPSCSLIL
jgi:hypothetical protein